MADDIAMLLTDVSRSVGNVENYLQKQNGGRRISKSSFKRSSVASPPPIAEVSYTLFSILKQRHLISVRLSNNNCDLNPR